MESDQKSSTVTKIINDVLHVFGIKGEIPHKFVRKLAHFTEFAILAVFVSITLHFSPQKLSILFSPAICFVCASADEILQNFSEGRGPQFSDVLIDTSGAICGTLAIWVLYLLVSKLTKKK